MLEGPSPKRRKGDYAPPTAEDIARSNDTLHQLVGNRRSWMTGGSGPISVHRRAASSSTGSGNTACRNAEPCATVAAAAAAQNQAAVASNARDSPEGVGQKRNRCVVDLVDYETPCDTAGNPIERSISENGIPGREGAKGPNRQPPLLPSPAPSEENPPSPITGRPKTNPPTPLIGQVNSNAQPSATRSNSRSARYDATTSNVAPQQRASANPQLYTTPRQPPLRAAVLSNATSPVQAQTPSLGHNPNARRSVSGSATAPTGQREIFQMPFHRPEIAMNHLDHFEALLRQRKLGDWAESDVGRLTLLRQAIEKCDWFYVVLNQAYCIRTIAPNLLPLSLARLPEQSWGHLASLLCDNRILNPAFTQWSAQFPDRILNIPSDLRPAYTWYYEKVAYFMSMLPLHWETVIRESRARSAPPIVQDLVDRMGMISSTLQTTAFRCIARNFWPQGGFQHGLEELEAIHQRDQHNLVQGNRLDHFGRLQTYAIYASIYRKWTGNQLESPGTNAAAMPNVNAQQQQTRPVQASNSFAHRQPPPRPGSGHFQQQQQQQQQQWQQQQQGCLQTNSMSIQAQDQRQQQQQQRVFPSNASSGSLTLIQGQWTQQPAPQQKSMRRPNVKSMYPAPHEVPRAQPTHPNTNKVALHQAHLRSPLLGPKELSPGADKMYRHVDSYILPPKEIDPSKSVHTISFDLSQEAYDKIPKSTNSSIHGERPTITLSESSRLYRLRCCKTTPTNTTNPNHWATSDNFWPDNLLFNLNGHLLETRRKLHHGRHLPLSLSPFLQPGTNHLTLSLTRANSDPRPFPYAIALESITTLSHATLTTLIPTVPATQSLADLQATLKPSFKDSSGDDGDDDIAIVSNTLTLTLTDPYSGCRIFETPVRGRSCLHRDCFDLETFLQMRQREFEGWASSVDDWRCPICRGDARPGELVCDGWLVDVRKQLEKQGKLGARGVVVEFGGSWRVKEEVRRGVRSESLKVEEEIEDEVVVGKEGSAGVSKGRGKRRVVEVVELD